MPSIRQDVFPATVAITHADFPIEVQDLRSQPPTKGSAAIQTARVVVTEDRVVIARDGGTGPQIVFSEKIDPSQHYKAARDKDSYVVTLSGKKVAFRKDSACGCGSRLKSWRPFGSSSSVKDPTE